MNGKLTRILMADDSRDDFEIVRELLSSIPDQAFKLDWASSELEALEMLRHGHYDLCLVDYYLGADSGLDLAAKFKQFGMKIPFILLTGQGGYEADVKAMRLGAYQFLSKNEMDAVHLERAVRYSLERARSEREVREQEKQTFDEKTKELQVERDQLRTQALVDSLTRLWNKRAILELLQMEWNRVSQTDSSLGLIMADLDHFKDINDTFGHPVGDMVLTETAHRIRTCLRKNDAAGRYGGEEFLIVLPEVDLALAAQIAERIRLAMVEENIITPRGIVSATFSLGVGVISKNHNHSLEHFIDQVDKVLYEAKRNGRNQVCQISPE